MRAFRYAANVDVPLTLGCWAAIVRVLVLDYMSCDNRLLLVMFYVLLDFTSWQPRYVPSTTPHAPRHVPLSAKRRGPCVRLRSRASPRPRA